MTVAELHQFASEYLHLDYIFWGTQEPYYSTEILPYLRGSRLRTREPDMMTPPDGTMYR